MGRGHSAREVEGRAGCHDRYRDGERNETDVVAVAHEVP
jgi:hypothetical protein